MEMTITNRDKKLLSFLAVFLILIGFIMLVLLPQMDKIEELADERDQLEIQKIEMDAQLKSLAQVQSTNQSLKEQQQEMGGQFYPLLSTQAIDRMLTGVILKCGLSADSLNVSIMQPPLSIIPYQGSLLYQQMVSEIAAGESGEVNLSKESFPKADQIYTAEVSVTAVGTEAQVQSLIDAWNQEGQPIRVMEYSISRQKQNGKAVDQYVIHMSVTVYMYQEAEDAVHG